MQLTSELVARCTGARIDRATVRAASLNWAMSLYGIDASADRQAMFLANIGHETGGLKYRVEIWQPTATQKRYERDLKAPWPKTVAQARLAEFAVNRKAFGLGNSEVGDGERFMGRGDLQTTGRANYIRLRDRLRVRFPQLNVPDFELQPELVADPLWAALAAADYVEMAGCNAYADRGDFDGYCDLINFGRKTEGEGDTNGFEHRLALYEKALPVLQLLHN